MIVKRWLNMAKFEYEQLMKVEAGVMGSVGLTARYEAIGGHGSGISDHTARLALSAVRVDEAYRRKMLWLDAIMTVFERYNNLREGGRPKPLIKGMHDRCVAQVLYGKVFRGWSLQRIGQLLMKANMKLSRQAVAKQYREAVDAIVAEAEARGLFDG